MAYTDKENFAGPRGKRRRRPPVVGESARDKAAIRPQGTTQARYTDVVRGAQQNIAQGYADDPYLGRSSRTPGQKRRSREINALTNQVFGYATGAAAFVPGPTSLPLSALSAIALSQDKATRDQFRGAKQRVDEARKTGDKSKGARAALDFALITGAVGGMGGGAPKPSPKTALPDEATLGKIPHLRYVPAIVNPKDPTDIRVGTPGGEHFEIPGYNPDRPWPQATAVVENGQIARVNWSRSGELADPNWPDLDDAFYAQAGDEVRRALSPRPLPPESIVGALPEARRVRAEQEKLRKAERRERVGSAKAAREAAGGGEAGLRASRAEMRGEYARLPFDRLAKEYGAADSELRKAFQPQVDDLLDHIEAHPSQEGLEFRIANTQDALLKMLDGQSITKSEIKALESVFGDEAAQYFKWRTAREKALKLANIPRSMQASYDLSAGLRQLLVAGVRHPVVWQRVMRASVQAARSQKAADAWLDAIRADPRYDQMIDDGVKLTDIKVGAKRLEEDFIGAEYAERIPVVGRPVKWSQRAFTVAGAKMRADLYNLFMDQAERAGTKLTKKERRDFASVINAATGRGGMGLDVLEKAAPLGTVLLFSPRLIASRLAFINPLWYAKLSGPARKEAASSFLSVLALGSAVLWLAEQLGAEVETDPRSADFGKIRVGDTRIDIWGGFQQYVVNGYRYAVAETKAPDGTVKDKTREEILWNFGSGKAAPLPGLVRDLQRGRTFDYQPIDEPLAGVPYGSAVGKLFVPFNIQNAYDAKDDPALAAASLALGGIGLGVQTYDSDDDKPAPAGPPGGSLRDRARGYRTSRARNYAGPRR